MGRKKVKAKPLGTPKQYVRPTPEARHAMKRLWTALQSPALFGDDLLQEDFVTATWLWLAEMDIADVVDGVRPHIKVVQAYWDALEPEQEGAIGTPGAASHPKAAHVGAPEKKVSRGKKGIG